MRALAALLLACACSGGGGGGDSTPPPPPPPPSTSSGAIWGISPFVPGCGGGGGVLYVNAEAEPHIAADPRDANHLIGVWQQDRWSNASSRGLVTGVSFDAGATWTFREAPFAACAGGNGANGGDYLRATDPWVAFAPDGTAYQSALSSTGGTFGVGSLNAVLVSRSTDGGLTWSNPATLIRDGAAAFNDKETITADPLDARFVYAVWDRLLPGGNGPTYFARSVDSGATWEAARAIYDPGSDQQTIGNLIRVLPDGTLVNLMAVLKGDENKVTDGSLEVIRSTDHGATWSTPVRVADFRPLGARDPTTGQAIRDGSIVPQMAAAPDSTLYVVWQDGRFSGSHDGIALARSVDGGLTWSSPARINADPSVPAFTPQVHVRADGMIGVTYFDLRSDTAEAPLLTDYWLARSADGASWSESHVDGPFDIAAAPLVTGAFFLGDYMGLASAATTFLPLYVRTTASPANRTDVFLARIAATAGVADGWSEPKRAPPMPPAPWTAEFHARAFGHLHRARGERVMR